jgi:hypothetical protein
MNTIKTRTKDKQTKKPSTQYQAQTLNDWCCEFSIRMTLAFAELPTKEDRLELAEHIRQTIDGLETNGPLIIPPVLTTGDKQ